MKESTDTNPQPFNIILNTEKDDMFYSSESELIPNEIKEDFKTKQNFLLVFVNPKSGSQQGKIVMEHAERYRIENIPEYNIISFPIQEEKLRKRKSTDSESNISIDEKGDKTFNIALAKFDPLIEFSTIIFNIIDKNEMEKGKKSL